MVYKDLVSKSRKELQGDIQELESKIAVLRAELATRRLDDSFGWGFRRNGTWTSWDSYGDAVSEAVEHFGDPDAGYMVTKVYKIK